MAIQIINAGSNLKIVVDDSARLVAKSSVKSVRIVEDFIKLHSEACCAPWDYLPFAEITLPVAADIEEMRNLIGDMLVSATPSTPSAAGLATEAKQSEAIGQLNEIRTSVINGTFGKATAVLQNTQQATLQNIYTVLQSLQTTTTNAATAQATLVKQNDIISTLINLQNTLLDECLYHLPPLRTEEVTFELRYEGFALPGAAETAPVWAIRKCVITATLVIYTWAGGSKLRAHIWANRAMLPYT